MGKTITSILSYLGCIGMTLFITYYLDGTVGILLTAALLCAFVLSLLLTLFAYRMLSVKIAADRQILNKGERLFCIVTISMRVPLPVPLVEVVTDCPLHFEEKETDRYFGSLTGPGSNEIRIPFTAKHCGAATVTITDLRLGDFLGIFSFRLPLSEEQRRFTVSIYPDILDIAAPTDFLRTAALAAQEDEEEEESDENAPVAGTPGYDHRSYEPGDPIRRINWKLSSKRDVFLIRLDEQIRGEGSLFFLDAPVMEETDASLTARDTVIEGALTLFLMLMQEGRDACFFLCMDGVWHKNELHTASDVMELVETFCAFRPAKTKMLLPEEVASGGKTPICFTTAVAGKDESARRIAAQFPNAMFLSALTAGLTPLTGEHWTISPEFEFRKQTV